MSYILPQDGYDTFITAAISTGDSEIFVNSIPTQTSGVLTIYDQDGRTIREKIYYTGTSGAGTSVSPYKLTGVVRDIRRVPVSGAVLFTTGGSPVTHASNRRIAMTDNINYLGVALAVLNGDMEMGGVMQLPASRSINSSRDVTDKEYVDAIAATAGGISAFMVSQNGADPSLTINVGAGRLLSGTEVIAYAGSSAVAVTASQTNYVQLDWNGTLLVNITGFLEGYVPLAEVVTNGTDITGITDRRAWLTSVGAFDNPITDRFTLGATLAAKDPVYYDTATGKLKKALATSSATADLLVGIMVDSGVDTDTGKRVQIGGVITGVSGLTAGSLVYLTDAGAFSATPGTYRLAIGFALSTTSFLFRQPRTAAETAGSNSATTTANWQELMTLINATDITGAELETLSAGATSNADALHTHPAFVHGFNFALQIREETTTTISPQSCGYSDGTIKTLSVNGYEGGAAADGYVAGYNISTDVGAAIFQTLWTKFDMSVALSASVLIGTDYWTSEQNGTPGNTIRKNGSTVTISGTTPSNGGQFPCLGHDPTLSYLLVLDATTRIRRYSGIAGTTITYVDDITLDTAVSRDVGFLFDNTNSRYICVDATNNLLRRFNSTGTTIDTVAYTISDADVHGICMIKDRVYLIVVRSQNPTGASVTFGLSVDLIPTNMTR